ncbi:MAG: hypothetical protein ACFFBD_05745 [Candidatus Hodarchaeota archaeon]
MRFSHPQEWAVTPIIVIHQTNVPTERREVTPLEMNTSTEVSLTNRISIRNSLASANIVDEQGSPLLSSMLASSR